MDAHCIHEEARLVRRRFFSRLNRSRFELFWALPAWVMLGLARLLLKVIPFVRLAPWLGRAVELDTDIPSLDQRQHQRARLIGRTIQFAARHTPWLSTCFTQVVAARCLLRLYRVPYVIFFGLARGSDGLQAHAWITAGEVKVTGGIGFDRFVVVGCFLCGAGAVAAT